MSAVRQVVALVVASAAAMALTLTAGCGSQCGEGTEEVNGTCVNNRPAPQVVECLGDTTAQGDQCVGPGIVIPDGGPPPDGVDPIPCEDNPSACPSGTECVEGVCTLGEPPTAEVTDLNRDLLPQIADPDLVEEDGALIMYYTLVGAQVGLPFPFPDALDLQTGGNGDGTMGRAQMVGLFGLARVEIDPKTLSLVGDPVQITDFPGPVISPDLTPDGLTIVFQSLAEFYGGTATGTEDLIVASRDSIGSPWGNFRVLTEISHAARADIDPTLRVDENGRPVQIYWVRSATTEVNSNSTEICTAEWNADDNTAVGPGNGPDGQPICVPYQPPGSPVVISDPFSAENCPKFTSDGRFYGWARAGLGTAQFDMFLARVSDKDGVADVFLGAMTAANSPSNELGLTFAPIQKGMAGVFAFTTGDDLVSFNGSQLHLGRLPALAE